MNPRGSGRFAPSATGPLHSGSLFTALISFLQARKLGLDWMIRIEDTDLERCRPEHTQTILDQLSSHGLETDAPLLIQSSQLPRYEAAAQQLLKNKHAYFCQCTRASIKRRAQASLGQNVHDDDWCQGLGLTSGSIRFKVNNAPPPPDCLQGSTGNPDSGDPVLVRANGLINYVLSTAIDDGDGEITQIVRGIDLMNLSSIQSQIRLALKLPNNQTHAHLPVLVNPQGQKLSKQNLSPQIEIHQASQNLIEIFALININLSADRPSVLLDQALRQFDIHVLKGLSQLPATQP